ncbi:hypothetical protein [Sedimenticola sp.]|uniref:hypothetical protein n=1 Tax=Sedimenticola sp. TaxID=1940285 RepID=UPI003D108645
MSTKPTIQRIEHCRLWLLRWLQSRQRRSTHSQPDWTHLPVRVWRRNSALMVTLHEQLPRGTP